MPARPPACPPAVQFITCGMAESMVFWLHNALNPPLHSVCLPHPRAWCHPKAMTSTLNWSKLEFSQGVLQSAASLGQLQASPNGKKKARKPTVISCGLLWLKQCLCLPQTFLSLCLLRALWLPPWRVPKLFRIEKPFFLSNVLIVSTCCQLASNQGRLFSFQHNRILRDTKWMRGPCLSWASVSGSGLEFYMTASGNIRAQSVVWNYITWSLSTLKSLVFSQCVSVHVCAHMLVYIPVLAVRNLIKSLLFEKLHIIS